MVMIISTRHIALFLFFFIGVEAAAQTGLTVGERLPDLPREPALNQAARSGRPRVTVVDFFGTWCVPCLKALPHLRALKDSIGDELEILLVSSEGRRQLQKFVDARPSFSFPVIIDSSGAWEKAFQPPSLPYTAVVDEKGTIIALTDAASLTVSMLKAQVAAPQKKEPSRIQTAPTTAMPPLQKSAHPQIALSQEFLYASRTGEDVTTTIEKLAGLNYADLVRTLQTDVQKKAFWINVYNGYVQYLLQKNPGRYQDRRQFFRAEVIRVAGQTFSLDAIEHGILRRSRIKWSLGHLRNPFAGRREKELRVTSIDYRIHFALNCGAKSCPPIAFYSDASLDAQLDLATRAYLGSEASYDEATGTLKLPRLMSWFRADFGGKKGMVGIARKLGVLPEGARPKIDFLPYDWSLTLNNYSGQKP